MQSGKLRHLLVLESPSVTRNVDGSETITYSDAATVFGSVAPVSGREYFLNKQTTSDTTYKIVIRYHPTVKTSWRVRHEHHGKTYNIQNILPTDGRRIEQVIYAVEATIA